jgi:hypothetical protein
VSLPVTRFADVGATVSEIAALLLGYQDSPVSVQQSLDARLETLGDNDLRTLLTMWRAGALFGGVLPFGAQVAQLTGNPADDVDAISAGTGQKLTVSSLGGIPLTQKGAASGVGTLDSGGHQTLSEVPSSVVTDSRTGAAIPIDSTGAVTGNALVYDSVEGVWEPGTVGGSGGAPTVRKFSFAYNTPGLAAGYAFYTPTPGDLLLNAWFEILTAWNGTTPLGDIGYAPFTTGPVGLWNYAFGGYQVDMTQAAVQGAGPTGVGPVSMINGFTELYSLQGVGNAWDALNVPAIPSTPAAQQQFGFITPVYIFPSVPLRFLDATPLSVCVSRTGMTNGASPGSSQGSAILYLTTATPV